MAGSIAQVAVDVALDRPLDYRVPAGLVGQVQLGSHVRVPLGRRQVEGFVVGLPEESAVPQLRPISGLVHPEPLLGEVSLALAEWISRYYCCPIELALRAVLPEPVRSGERWRRRKMVRLLRALPADAAERDRLFRRAPRRLAILEELVGDGPAPLSQLVRRHGTAAGAIVAALARGGWVEIAEGIAERDPADLKEEVVASEPLRLNADQQVAMDLLRARLDQAEPGVLLLHGVTGSGKTELYLQAIEEALRRGRGAVMLVPEISLTPQTVERFRSRLGDVVAVLHSHLSAGERHDQWHRLRRGEARVAVGARSAVFAPVRRPALIVIDEEHDASYKQGEAPRYHARDVGIVRARMEGALAVLGSATPALESYHNAEQGKYHLARLPARVESTKLPVIRVVDLRDEASRGGGLAVFSARLVAAVEARLERGEQTILFLNRRGYSSSLICPACGHVCRCPNCSLAMTYHRDGEVLRCHYCDHREAPPRCCPEPRCGKEAIRYAGFGTQRIEQILARLFPRARVARMDSDTMRRKNRYREVLGAFRLGQIDILIGTQMIAKGLHFPNVTLVGIIQADMGLHMPDFRAGERTFQLLTQVAGRAGRGSEPGEVYVQTFTPFHPAIQCAYRQDYAGFYAEEVAVRRDLALPPWAHLVLIEVLGADLERVERTARRLAGEIGAWPEPRVRLSGPAPAPLARLRGEYRVQLMLRTRRITAMAERLRPVCLAARRERDVRVVVDVDPVYLM